MPHKRLQCLNVLLVSHAQIFHPLTGFAVNDGYTLKKVEEVAASKSSLAVNTIR